MTTPAALLSSAAYLSSRNPITVTASLSEPLTLPPPTFTRWTSGNCPRIFTVVFPCTNAAFFLLVKFQSLDKILRRAAVIVVGTCVRDAVRSGTLTLKNAGGYVCA